MNKFGTYTGNGYALTYQIGESVPQASLTDKGRSITAGGQIPLTARRMGKYFYWPAGINNDEPDVCAALIKGNRLLPSLIEKQVAILYAVVNDYLVDVDVADIRAYEQGLYEYADNNAALAEVMQAIRETGKLESEAEEKLKAALKEYTDNFCKVH